MNTLVAAFGCAFLFAVGLGISGMTLPSKVLGFLDITGNWDPSLLFVMGGAVLVYAVGFRYVVKKPKPLFTENFQLPTLRKVDRRLAIGSAIFGMGWGLAGYCPGPALVSLGSLYLPPLIFVLSMFTGMFLFELTNQKKN